MLVWQAHKGKIESAAFSADGRLLATATGGTSLPYLWDPTSGKLVRKLAGASGTVKSVCFAPDAPLFAAGTHRSVTVWRTDSWAVVAELKMEYAYELAFGPGQDPVLVASDANAVGVWGGLASAAPGNRKPRTADRRATNMYSVAALHVSPDGRLLATSTTSQARVWRLDTLKSVRMLRKVSSSNRGAIRFDPVGQRVANAYGKWVEVWPVAEGDEPLVRFAAGTGRSPIVWAVNWSADGKSLLTAGNDGCVRVWDTATGAELKTFEWDIGKLYCAAFSPDGLTCAACGEKGQVVVWDVDT
jgi:WD40 repeat protein